MTQYRRIAFTLHLTDAQGESLPIERFSSWEPCEYAVFQVETAPSTGARHIQGYCEFRSPMRLASIKRRLGNTVHVEKAVADRHKNREYCTKAESRAEGPWEFIRNPAQQHAGGGPGARNDIAEFRDAIKAGSDDAALWGIFPGLMARYPGMVREVRRAFASRRDFKPEVHIHFGAPGTGKSRLVNAEAPLAYRKVPGKWWDHYCGEPDVVMDDFYGGEQFPYSEFLKLTDWYDYMAECKGGMVKVNPRRIFITSNRHPREWFAAAPEYEQWAFFRRITSITHWTGGLPAREDVPIMQYAPLFERNRAVGGAAREE